MLRPSDKLARTDREMATRKYVFFDIGFHGDKYLCQVVSDYLRDATHFLETGTNVGSTLQYVGSAFPHVQCISCEPDEGAFHEAVKNTRHLDNVRISNTDSISFLETIRNSLPERGRGLVCWLDAHGHGFQWPLREEVRFLSKHFPESAIFIDDFRVPDRPDFGYDAYDGQECSFQFIRDSIANERLGIAYPNYTEHTSPHHPLRGWCLMRDVNQQAKPSEVRYTSIRSIGKSNAA